MNRLPIFASMVFVAGIAAFASCGPGTTRCDASSCPNGCCDEQGQCRQGSAVNACGANGQRCSACSTGQVCVSGACRATDAGEDAGVDAGADAGWPYYCSDVHPIVEAHCASCHGDNTAASGRSDFKLTVYDDFTTDAGRLVKGARTMAPFMREQMRAQTMPPGGGTITPAQRDTIMRWADAGAPLCADAGR